MLDLSPALWDCGDLQIVGILFLGIKKMDLLKRTLSLTRLSVALSVKIRANTGPESQRIPAVPHQNLSLLCSAELSAPELSVGSHQSPKLAPRLVLMPKALVLIHNRANRLEGKHPKIPAVAKKQHKKLCIFKEVKGMVGPRSDLWAGYHISYQH